MDFRAGIPVIGGRISSMKNLLDIVARPVLYLDIYLPDILSHQSNGKQLKASQEPDG